MDQSSWPNISIIIPAYNAAATLRQTLDSLFAQTNAAWEAIVVDDGSSDETPGLARQYARQDARIRLVEGEHQGVSSARNTGIHQARFDWLAFLDADDWVSPDFLQSMAQALFADPSLDAVHCGWARVMPDGTPYLQHTADRSGLLFEPFMESCLFPVNACVVRKALVLSAQGFDPALTTCEDWDLWLRVARAGARFGVAPQVLSFYRSRPDSASANARQLLADAFRVLERAHSPDSRLPYQHPDYPTDLPPQLFLARKYQLLCWSAGLMIAAGEDALSLLDALPLKDCPELDVIRVIDFLAESAQSAACVTVDTPIEFWVGLWPRLQAFLQALEDRTKVPNLVDTGSLRMLRLALQDNRRFNPISFGSVHALRLELEQPIVDIHLPVHFSRLLCQVELEGRRLGILELPVFDGLVPRDVLADAIVAEYAWVILDRFFQSTLYAGFDVRRDSYGIAVWRGEVCLADGLEDRQDSVTRLLHGRAGWTIFLQEIWGFPDRPQSWFYDPQVQEPAGNVRTAEDGWLSLDTSEDLPDVVCPFDSLHIMVSVGGIGIGVVTLPVEQGRLSAHILRAALTRECGFELCRAAVREGLLGQPLSATGFLRERLTRARQQAAKLPFQPPSVQLTKKAEFAGDWQLTLMRALQSVPGGVALPRYPEPEIDTSASRRAVFPSSVYSELVEAAAQMNVSLVYAGRQPGQAAPGVYAPDLISKDNCGFSPPNPVVQTPESRPFMQDHSHGRNVFEAVFAEKTDPWQYTSPYEQTKYQQSLDLLPDRRFKRALEIGCAEGHFTIQLAPRVDVLVAADISRVALQRAALRCAGLDNVQFLTLDLSREPLPGQFDLIVCSETLYYMGGREALPSVAEKLSAALLPGGLLLLAHAHLVVDDPGHAGFNWDHPYGALFIANTFEKVSQLRLVRELRTPLYRIQLFQRTPRFSIQLGRKLPEIVELDEQPAPPPPGADLQVLWQGGEPQRSETGLVETSQLPILMYHRIAPQGSRQMRPYRVAPAEFEEQVRYLHDAGYYCVTIEAWHAAMKEHRPLPGRAILLSFDDGYRDFKEYAWPILKQYGFSALVFLVSGHIGYSNSWDRLYGETVSLMNWDEIRELEEAGVQFGSHASSHTALTAIPPAEALREAMRSRILLGQHLRTPLRSIAYPYGAEDPIIRHLVGASGFTYGFTTRAGRCGLWESLLGLPRIEVSGSDRFEDFVRKLV